VLALRSKSDPVPATVPSVDSSRRLNDASPHFTIAINLARGSDNNFHGSGQLERNDKQVVGSLDGRGGAVDRHVVARTGFEWKGPGFQLQCCQPPTAEQHVQSIGVVGRDARIHRRGRIQAGGNLHDDGRFVLM